MRLLQRCASVVQTTKTITRTPSGVVVLQHVQRLL
ncbi:unnamed protein product, partial [Angiostrongylus costaricensis]|uniref:Transcriptional regulator n=1 Tax=Angiostrongylus costaricensis TaxID=334426 RepID=A0A0R3PZQ7_ANGCS